MHHVLCKIADMLINLVSRHLYKTKKLRDKQWWKPVIVAGNAKFHIHGPDPGRGRGHFAPSAPVRLVIRLKTSTCSQQWDSQILVSVSSRIWNGYVPMYAPSIKSWIGPDVFILLYHTIAQVFYVYFEHNDGITSERSVIP